MDIKEVVRDLAIGITARQQLSHDPYDAAEEVIAFYNTLIVNLSKVAASRDALLLSLAVIRKEEVNLGDYPALEAEKIYRQIIEEL